MTPIRHKIDQIRPLRDLLKLHESGFIPAQFVNEMYIQAHMHGLADTSF